MIWTCLPRSISSIGEKKDASRFRTKSIGEKKQQAPQGRPPAPTDLQSTCFFRCLQTDLKKTEAGGVEKSGGPTRRENANVATQKPAKRQHCSIRRDLICSKSCMQMKGGLNPTLYFLRLVSDFMLFQKDMYILYIYIYVCVCACLPFLVAFFKVCFAPPKKNEAKEDWLLGEAIPGARDFFAEDWDLGPL